jgi:hypothetical protein
MVAGDTVTADAPLNVAPAEAPPDVLNVTALVVVPPVAFNVDPDIDKLVPSVIGVPFPAASWDDEPVRSGCAYALTVAPVGNPVELLSLIVDVGTYALVY